MRLFHIACLALMLSLTGAQAQEIKQARGLVCDPQRQVEQIVRTFDGTDGEAVVKAVNAEAGKQDACVVAVFAYIEGGTVIERITNSTGAYKVIELPIIALPTPAGWQRLPQPVVWYTAMPLPEQGV